MSPALSSWIALPDSKCVVIKAVLSPTPNKQGREEEEIAGWVCWSFKGLNNDNIVEKGSVDAEHKDVTDKRSSIEDGMKTQEHDQEREKISSDTSLSKIERLNAITNASMSFWQNKLTPQNAKCLILVALTVSPSQQGQGIGSSLIRCGTHIADEQGVYCWVSSSDGGYKAFEKAVFDELGWLSLNLDVFADGVKNEGGENGKWGEYIWRYMRREASTKE
jgi:GNAT superfamily N-acetyltransferase